MNILKVGSIALATLAIAAIALLSFAFAPTLFGYETFIVTSGSMGQANPLGSVAVTKMVDVGTIRQGDVVSFQTKSKSRITHRISDIKLDAGQTVFITKGDANPLPDPEPLRLSSGKLSRVEWSVPFAGHVVRHIRTPIGAVALFAIPILGLILGKRQGSTRRSASRPVDNAQPPASSTPLMLRCPHCREDASLEVVLPKPLEKVSTSGSKR